MNQDILERIEIVVRRQQFFPLDAEYLGDLQGLVGDRAVQTQDLIELIGGQEVPVRDLPAERCLDRMRVDDLLFHRAKFWSGINWTFLGGPLAEIFNLPQNGGLLVQRVVPLSPLGMMGVKAGTYEANIEGLDLKVGGDIILEVNGIPVTSEENFTRIIDSFNDKKPGDELTLKVLRAGRVQDLKGEVPPN